MKRHMIFALVLILTLLGILAGTLPAMSRSEVKAQAAATYWVSPDGQAAWADCKGDTPLDGTDACALSTANQNVLAGDTVYLREGIYNEAIAPANSGALDNLITFGAFNGEAVTITNQLVPNRFHETAAWISTGGSTVEHSTEQAWQGEYSTKFTVNAEGQGIKSESFHSKAGQPGYVVSAWVYSDYYSVTVSIQRGDGGGVAHEETLSLIPNQWSRVTTHWFNAGATGDQAYIEFKSPPGTSSGVWYVDNVRMPAYQPSIDLNGKSYIKIEGITFDAVLQGFVIQKGSSYNEISHCVFTDMNMEIYYTPCIIMNGYNADDAPSPHNWIHDCVFHDNGFVVGSAGDSWDDIGNPLRLGASHSDDSRYNLIENNLFYHGGHDMIIISSRYNTIRNNIFHNEGWMANHYGPSQDADGDPTTFNDPVAGYGDRNMLFERPDDASNNAGYNLVEGNRIGHAGTPPDDDGANGIENPTDGNIVRYNYVYGNGTAGYYLKHQQDGGGVKCPNYNRIYNNTFYYNGRGEDIDTGYQRGIKYNSYAVTPVGNVIKNNILYDNAIANIGGQTDQVIYVTNTYTNNLEIDPLFVNPDLSDKTSLTLPDLSLQSNSQAINQGWALTTVTISDTGSGTSLIVADASYFQDGRWAPLGRIEPDWIAVGSVSNVARISAIDYASNVISLSQTISRSAGSSVWLYKDSTGRVVLHGSAPDIGAYEFIAKQRVYLPLVLK